MDGIAAARPLTRSAGRPAPGSPGFDVCVASPSDEAEIRRLLRASSFGTAASLSLEREPDSSLAATIEGDAHCSLIARERRSGAVAAVASRSVRAVFINGRRERVAYLGQLRIEPRFRRHRSLLAAGFEHVRCLQHRDGVHLHLASVVADNVAARRLLARRAPGWPSFEAVDTLVSLAIPTGAAGRVSQSVDTQPGSMERLDDIAGCLSLDGERFQFSPVWSREDLLSRSRCRGLALDDFIAVHRGGRMAGCAACWNQRAFKQVVVRGYSRRLRRWRWLVNGLSPLIGVPPLPQVGEMLNFAYLSHFALVDSNDDETAVDLIRAALRRARQRGLDYVVLGLSTRHPLVDPIRRAFRHRSYESILYVAFWPEGEALASALDARPSHPELAIL